MLFYILFYGFLAYILYKLVFNFIIPIYKTTRQVKKGFRDMQEKMRGQADPYGQTSTPAEPKSSVVRNGDYIDFEEIK